MRCLRLKKTAAQVPPHQNAVEVEEEERQFSCANNSAKSADESSSSADDEGIHQFDPNSRQTGSLSPITKGKWRKS